MASIIPAASLLPPESEKQFSDQFDSFARALGWLTYHTYDSRKSQAGFPDFVLVRGNRLLFAELKRVGGQPTQDQRRWLEALRGAQQVDSTLWTPDHWDTIAKVLTR